MAKKLNEVVGSMEYDGLIVSGTPAADVVTVTLAAGNGELKRGTIVTGTAGGELAPASAALSGAVYILTDDVDATEAVVATAYRTGHFATNKLITAGEYALTAADKEYLRKSGILVSDAIEL
jgi:hypothetical protein